MISIENKGNCTIFKVTDEVTVNEILMQLAQYMSGEQTDTAIWDFAEAKRVKITTLEVSAVAENLKEISKGKQVRRVALVGSKNINIGLGKLFVAFAEMAGLPNEYKVFRDISIAKEWLGVDSDDHQLLFGR